MKRHSNKEKHAGSRWLIKAAIVATGFVLAGSIAAAEATSVGAPLLETMTFLSGIWLSFDLWP